MTSDAQPPAAEGSSAAGRPGPEARPSGRPRRLTRSTHDRVVAGVAAGVAEYLVVDAVWVRIAFVLLAIFGGGLGVVLYVIAWLVMPEDGDTVARPRPRGAGGPAAGLAFGLLLVGAGALWLLAMLDVPTPRWDVVLSAALILVGLALIAGARRGVNGGLVAVAVALTVALAAISSADVRVDAGGGAFGERAVRPVAVAQLEREYSHVFGSLSVDLRDLELPEGTTSLDVGVVFGDLQLRLPPEADDFAVRVDASTVFGSTEVFGRDASGVAGDQTHTRGDWERARRRLHIDLSSVFGSAGVR